jgi:hypothetical protein
MHSISLFNNVKIFHYVEASIFHHITSKYFEQRQKVLLQSEKRRKVEQKHASRKKGYEKCCMFVSLSIFDFSKEILNLKTVNN